MKLKPGDDCYCYYPECDKWVAARYVGIQGMDQIPEAEGNHEDLVVVEPIKKYYGEIQFLIPEFVRPRMFKKPTQKPN